MSQQQKLEKVLDLLLNEDSDRASELLHQIIVEKARTIYESIVDEESNMPDEEKGDYDPFKDMELDESTMPDEEKGDYDPFKDMELDEKDEVGGEPNKDFTDEISADEDEIDADEFNDGEAEDEDKDEGSDDEEIEDRVEDLESQLAELRAEFDALMAQEMEEPYHDDLGDEMDEIESDFDTGSDSMQSDFDTETTGDDMESRMFEKKKTAKLEKAPQAKDKKKEKKVDEETQFLTKVADTGQKGSAKLVGTGKDTPLGAEQTKSPFSKAPSKPSYGGTPDNLLGSKTTGGEYGKYHGESATDDTPSDNVKVEPKKSASHVDKTEGKFVGTGKGSKTGKTDVNSLFTKTPSKPGSSKG